MDASLPQIPTRDFYAVLSVEYATFAYTFLMIAMCPDYQTLSLSVTESEEMIHVDMRAARRTGRGKECAPFARSPLAETLFNRYAAKTDLSFSFSPDVDGFAVRLSFVRYQAGKYANGGVTEREISQLILLAADEYTEILRKTRTADLLRTAAGQTVTLPPAPDTPDAPDTTEP